MHRATLARRRPVHGFPSPRLEVGISELAVPTSASGLNGITTGPDGALWFTEADGNDIGRITTSGTISETAVPTTNSYPIDITAGPDGKVWFTKNNANQLGVATP